MRAQVSCRVATARMPLFVLDGQGAIGGQAIFLQTAIEPAPGEQARIIGGDLLLAVLTLPDFATACVRGAEQAA
jgi:hypothetical protein